MILEQIQLQTELLDPRIDLELSFISSSSQLALIKKIHQAILENTDQYGIQRDLVQYKNLCFNQSVLLGVFVKGLSVLSQFRQRLELPEDFTLDEDTSVLIPSSQLQPISSSPPITALQSDAQQQQSARTDKPEQNSENSWEDIGSSRRSQRLAAKIGLFGKAVTEGSSNETETIDEEPLRYRVKKPRGKHKKMQVKNTDLTDLKAKIRGLEDNIALLQQEKKIYESITAKYLATDVYRGAIMQL